MAETPPTLTFLGWQRQGAASIVKSAPTTGERATASVEVQVRVTRGGTTSEEAENRVTTPLELRGPGDVLALSPKAIRRVWPRPHDQDVVENLFPLLELDAADLPWRYTPEAPTAAPNQTSAGETRLKPWFCLLALREDWEGRGDGEPECGLLPSKDPEKGLPTRVLIRSGTPLPNLEYAWAWAHVERLDGDPDGGIARVLCPRRLAPMTRYRVVLVPTFLSGVRAGLGQPIEGSGLQPAWALPAGQAFGSLEADLELPVYHQWRFRTGESGDIGSIARLLRLADTLPPGVGRMTLKVDLGLPMGVQELDLETALGETPAPTDLRAPGLLGRGQVIEALGLNDPPHDPETGDPMIRMPIYGEAHAAARRRVGRHAGTGGESEPLVKADGADWVSRLNADPRWRVVAGLGAETVRRHQEAFMEEAWAWLEAHRTDVAMAQMRSEVQYNWRKRVVVPFVNDALASANGAWKLGRVAPLVKTSLLRASGKTAHPLAESQLRRTLRPGTRLGKAIRAGKATEAVPFAHAVQSLEKALQDPLARTRLSVVANTTKSVTVGGLSASGVLRRLGSREQLERDVPPPLPAPRIEAPIASLINEISTDWLLAGAGALPNHRIYLLRTNPNFVESLFAGMNHEIAREFLWREFPTDGRATVFAHFWESLDTTSSPAVRDLMAWKKLGENTLGGEPLVLLLKTPLLRRYPGLVLFLGRFETTTTGEQSLVGAAVRPLFGGQLSEDVSFFGFRKPWSGKMPSQEWNFVLQEQLQAPRFGLALPPSGQSLPIPRPQGLLPDDQSWGHFGEPAWLAPTKSNAPWLAIQTSANGSTGATLGGATTAASFARATYQKPIQIMLSASILLQS